MRLRQIAAAGVLVALLASPASAGYFQDYLVRIKTALAICQDFEVLPEQLAGLYKLAYPEIMKGSRAAKNVSIQNSSAVLTRRVLQSGEGARDTFCRIMVVEAGPLNWVPWEDPPCDPTMEAC